MANPLTLNEKGRKTMQQEFKKSNEQSKDLDDCESLDEAIEYMKTLEQDIIRDTVVSTCRLLIQGILTPSESIKRIVARMLYRAYYEPVEDHFDKNDPDIADEWMIHYNRQIAPKLVENTFTLVEKEFEGIKHSLEMG